MKLAPGKCGLALCIAITCLSPLAAATAKKKTPAKPAQQAPAISQAVRDAAAQRVADALAANPAFDQPEALTPFFHSLDKLAREPGAVHIIHFGDSHTAADQWTGAMRYLLQKQFGPGGSGYMFAGHPFAGYRRAGTLHGATAGWTPQGLVTGEGDGYFGLGGVSIQTHLANQSVFIETVCSRVQIYYLQMPGGGALTLFDNGQPVREISTDGELAPGISSYQTEPGTHNLKLVTRENKPVRLLGWAADLDSGVTYEALGINGAQASLIFRWNEDMFATFLRQRDPALIVLAYGANEASDRRWTTDSYQAMFSALLRRLRTTCPNSSILVLGPTDRMIRTRTGVAVVEGIDRIIAAQRAAAAENSCAFWDAKARMGGSGSIRDWQLAGLAQADFVHFTSTGYDRLGQTLFDDILRLYEQHLRMPAAPSSTSDASPNQSN